MDKERHFAGGQLSICITKQTMKRFFLT